jgi:16S rRNA processing protein RimM
MDQDQVVIAEIIRERGNRGELLVASLTDVPGRIESLTSVRVRLKDGSDTVVEVESAWMHQGTWVLKFAGVDSIDAAQVFRGADIWVPREERGQLGEGNFFQADLVGCQVIDRQSESSLGTVSGFQQYGGPALLEVQSGDRELLIPFVEAICPVVDLAARTVVVDPPDGLLELFQT